MTDLVTYSEEQPYLNPDLALLGALLSSYPDVDRIAKILDGPEFSEPLCEEIYRACLRVNDTGMRIDPITIQRELNAETLRMLHNNPVHLVTLAHNCPNPLEAPEYARQVRDNYMRRSLATINVSFHDDLANLDQDPYVIGERAAMKISDAIADRGVSQVVSMADVLPKVIDVAESGQPLGLPTPWPDLNRLIQGLAPGRFIVVGSRPGVGKSVMGTDLARDVAGKHGHTALIASMEMPRIEVGQRILAAQAGVNLTRLEHGKLSETEWHRIKQHTDPVLNMPIVIEDSGAQTLGSIRSAVKEASKKSRVALVVVDYLQLIRPRDNRLKRHEQVGEASRGLKLLAREFEVCVVAMCQLNRASETRADRMPSLADLRESGDIEADADVVILLHRPEESGAELQAIVAKQRNGPRGTVPLMLQGEFARIQPGIRSDAA